jgi:hypothetical protein
MEAEFRPSDDVEDAGCDVLMPGDEPLTDVPNAPMRHRVVSIFTRRAFLSKDTGRWHKLPGGRDRASDGRADQ